MSNPTVTRVSLSVMPDRLLWFDDDPRTTPIDDLVKQIMAASEAHVRTCNSDQYYVVNVSVKGRRASTVTRLPNYSFKLKPTADARITIRLSDLLRTRIELVAAHERRSIASVIVNTLEDRFMRADTFVRKEA
jgi:hypothetical protein